MDLKSIFSRSKQPSAPEKRRKIEKSSTAGAHELFLEYEGFLPPSNPRPPKPSRPATKLAIPRVSQLHQDPKVRLSQDTSRDSTTSWEKPRKSFSGLGDAVHEAAPAHPKRIPSQRKNGLFSLHRSTRDQREGPTENYSKSSPVYRPEQGNAAHVPTCGWLRRCMSTTSRQSSPPPSFTTIPPYYGSPIFEDDDFTALPALPGYENEPQRPPEKVPSGAAARAAVAAQNEVLENIRNLRLAEPKVTMDSESGVGIEVRDRAEVMTDLDISVVRKGE